MIDQTGAPVYQSASPGLLSKGVIIRHMVLPGQRHDSVALLEWISDNLPRGRYMISLMSQYTPYIKNREFPELNRRITSYEYDPSGAHRRLHAGKKQCQGRIHSSL